MNVSERLVYMARRLLRSGRDDLVEAVDRGEMTVHAALKAALPRLTHPGWPTADYLVERHLEELMERSILEHANDRAAVGAFLNKLVELDDAALERALAGPRYRERMAKQLFRARRDFLLSHGVSPGSAPKPPLGGTSLTRGRDSGEKPA